MNIIADLHMHTMVSNHAFNTVTEMARRACELGMFAAALTDHGPSMPDAPHPWYFYNLLKGVEANVRGTDGSLDIEPQEFERMQLDWVIASIHSDTLCPSLSEDEATQLWLNVAQSPYVDCIGHSESRRHRYDYDAVTKAFARCRKVVEINANSAVVRPGNEENMRELALACKRNGTKIAVNSDAHSIYHLGQFDTVLPMLREIHFPEELVVNASRENLITVLKEHQKPVADLLEGSKEE